MFATPERYAGSVHASLIPNYLVVLARPLKNCLVDALSNASLHVFMELAPTSHPTTWAEFALKISHGITVLSTTGSGKDRTAGL